MVRHEYITLEQAIALHSIGADVEYSHQWVGSIEYSDSEWHDWKAVGGGPTRDWGWATQQDIQVRFRVLVED